MKGWKKWHKYLISQKISQVVWLCIFDVLQKLLKIQSVQNVQKMVTLSKLEWNGKLWRFGAFPMIGISQPVAEHLPSFSWSWMTENAENCFPSSLCPCHLRKQLLDFPAFWVPAPSGPSARYSQSLSWGSLGSRDPGWQIRQEAEELIPTGAGLPSSTLGSSWPVNQPKSLLAEKAPQSTAGTVPFSQNALVLMDWHNLWQKQYIRKFPDDPNSQSAFWVA